MNYVVSIILGSIIGFLVAILNNGLWDIERGQHAILEQNARIEANQRLIVCNQLQLLLSMNENAEQITANQSKLAVGPVRVKKTEHPMQLIRECDNE